jgi:hypothetical protein
MGEQRDIYGIDDLLLWLYQRFDEEFLTIDKKEQQYLLETSDEDNDKELQEAYYEGIFQGIASCMETISLQRKRLINGTEFSDKI